VFAPPPYVTEAVSFNGDSKRMISVEESSQQQVLREKIIAIDRETHRRSSRRFVGSNYSRRSGWLVGWLEFNVPFQHKCGYIRDE